MRVHVLVVALLLVAPVSWSGKKSKTKTSRMRGRMRGVRWWNLANTPTELSDEYGLQTPVWINPSLQPLTRKQRRQVHKHPGSIIAIAKGARMAVEECQYQFQDRRWNCPIQDDSHGQSIFGKIIRKGCRETSFIYAMTSAAVAHSVAKGCTEGSVLTCTCGRPAPRAMQVSGGRDWKWGGCSADFGYRFGKDFVDVAERGRDLRNMMNLHNNEAGRLHVSADLQQDCKCHGVSGSCTVKTCWMKLPSFRRVSTLIKEKFDGASKVLQDNAGANRASRSSSTKYNLMPVDRNHKPPGPHDLVYYEASPSFCDPDASVGFKGTRDRECNATSIGVDGCDLLCCGRGYRTETYEAKERCNCVFHWCCKVTCDTCTRTRIRHICN